MSVAQITVKMKERISNSEKPIILVITEKQKLLNKNKSE